MFDWLKRMQSGMSSAEELVTSFEQMLEDGRHMFDVAANTLLAGTDPETIKEDLWATDKRINRMERRVRRRVVTHLSTFGPGGTANGLVLMSLVKDAERIGDYCKNIFQLAELKRGLPEEVRKNLNQEKDSISRLLAKARNIYKSESEEDARAFIAEADEIAQRCDAQAIKMVMRDDTDGLSANAALSYRYFKRVISHALNIITSVVMPIDQLDYYDEDKESRE
jgi:phosphate uptake regulator